MNETQTPRTDAAESNWWSEDGLRSAFIVRADFARELERENAILTAERDEARRELCGLLVACHTDADNEKPDPNLKHVHAEIRGWDCFKENTNG